jgi:uncharacterized protein (DUF302 family)
MADESPFEVVLAEPFGLAVEMVEKALKEQDFSIVTRFDVQRALQDRLSVKFHPYLILGACNNRLTELALRSSACADLLLPCNISVEVTAQNQTLVRVADPTQLVSCKCEEDPQLLEVAEETQQHLLAVIGTLRDSTRPQDLDGKNWRRLAADLHE